MRLFGVEVRRILSRALVLAVALVGLAGVVLTIVGVGASVRPLTPEQERAAEQQYETAVADWEENGEEWLADCLEQEATERENSGQDVDFGCQDMEPQREWFFPTNPGLHEQMSSLLGGTSMLLGLVALIIGVTSTAAEMSTGAMSTWLTFVPQRMRVLFSKIGAAAAVTVPLTAVLAVVTVGGLYLVHHLADLTGGMDGEAWRDTVVVAGRMVLLGGIAGACGAALGVLLKHTGAALGVLLGYLVVVEQMLGGLVQRSQPFLLNLNIQAFVQGKASYWFTRCTVTDQGTSCEGVERSIGLVHASVLLAVVTVVVLGVTAAVFRRRDVV